MTAVPRVPSVQAGGRFRSADAVEALASRWHAQVALGDGPSSGPVAVALSPDAEGVALFAAVSARPDWFVLLPPDARVWPRLGLPRGTRVVLPPALASLATTARGGGIEVTVLSPAVVGAAAEPIALLRSAGIVLFTSGSTGSPKAVYRTMPALLAGVIARLAAFGLHPGDGIVAGVTLGHGHGLTRLLSAMCLGGPLALLAPLDYRAALAVLGQPRYALWSATAHFADVLGRCRLTGPAVVPPICLLSSPVDTSVLEAFRRRFGVPLRQNYSSTETGVIAAEFGPADDVQSDTVGRPLPGVEIRIGERPDDPRPIGEAARIWVRSPWRMAGYGFPPHVESPGLVGDWLPTRDLGAFRSDGRLVLSGRLDDCIRTREGRLVNLAAVARSFRALEGVRDAVVVPTAGAAGSSFGVVLVCAPATPLDHVRAAATAALPEWAWPRALVQVAALPRLPGGKVDRLRCMTLLERGA